MVNGKTKKATIGLVSLYTNKFGSNVKAVSEYAYTYDVFGCPVDYMGSVMTWDVNGKLTSVSNKKDKALRETENLQRKSI